MPLLIADASPIVGFTAGDEHSLLWQVVTASYGNILVPQHVDGEITRKTSEISRKARSNYDWMKRQSQVQVLPTPGTFDRVSQIAATLLQMSSTGIAGRTRDAGEAYAVAHAQVARLQRTRGLAPNVVSSDAP